LRCYSLYEASIYCDVDPLQRIGVITTGSFNLTSSRYIDQLVAAKNYESALIVCLAMSDYDPLLQRKSIIETTGRICDGMFEEENRDKAQAMQSFYLEKLHLPPKFIQIHVAMKNECNGDYVAALGSWIEAQNYEKAHEVFMAHIVPKSFGSGAGKLDAKRI